MVSMALAVLSIASSFWAMSMQWMIEPWTVLAVHTETTDGRYCHFRHLMKIIVLIRTYHKTYFNLFSLILTYFFDIFKGSELIISSPHLLAKYPLERTLPLPWEPWQRKKKLVGRTWMLMYGCESYYAYSIIAACNDYDTKYVRKKYRGKPRS